MAENKETDKTLSQNKRMSSILNNLKVQKIQSEIQNFKIDQMVKTFDDYYIIFSGNTIFKSKNNGEEGLKDLQKLKNGEISLGLSDLFIQTSLDNVKDEIDDSNILNFYKSEYSHISRVKDSSDNEMIVGVKPGSMDNLLTNTPILSDDKKYFKTRNHVYYENDTLNLLNAESKDISPGELKLLTSFLNNNNPNIRDFDGTDDKYGIKAYKNIEVINTWDFLTDHNIIIREYKVTDFDNNSFYITYQIENDDVTEIQRNEINTAKQAIVSSIELDGEDELYVMLIDDSIGECHGTVTRGSQVQSIQGYAINVGGITTSCATRFSDTLSYTFKSFDKKYDISLLCHYYYNNNLSCNVYDYFLYKGVISSPVYGPWETTYVDLQTKQMYYRTENDRPGYLNKYETVYNGEKFIESHDDNGNILKHNFIINHSMHFNEFVELVYDVCIDKNGRYSVSLLESFYMVATHRITLDDIILCDSSNILSGTTDTEFMIFNSGKLSINAIALNTSTINENNFLNTGSNTDSATSFCQTDPYGNSVNLTLYIYDKSLYCSLVLSNKRILSAIFSKFPIHTFISDNYKFVTFEFKNTELHSFIKNATKWEETNSIIKDVSYGIGTMFINPGVYIKGFLGHFTLNCMSNTDIGLPLPYSTLLRVRSVAENKPQFLSFNIQTQKKYIIKGISDAAGNRDALGYFGSSNLETEQTSSGGGSLNTKTFPNSIDGLDFTVDRYMFTEGSYNSNYGGTEYTFESPYNPNTKIRLIISISGSYSNYTVNKVIQY